MRSVSLCIVALLCVYHCVPWHYRVYRVSQASAHQKNLDVGANIFIGNLDPEVDEKLLYDTFSAFGVILQTPKVGVVKRRMNLSTFLNLCIIKLVYN